MCASMRVIYLARSGSGKSARLPHMVSAGKAELFCITWFWLGKLPVLHDRVLAGILNKLETFKAKIEVLHTG